MTALRLVVLGNCQAESLRLMLDGPDVDTVRLPAVHELVPSDLDGLHRVLDSVDVLVTQPVVDDYRGVAVGTAQLAARLRPGTRLVVVPGIRFAGLYPYHVLVHPPHLTDTEPPLAPYHDLRTVVAAAWRARRETPPPVPALTPAAVRAVAADSLAELVAREVAHRTVVVSDLLEERARAVGFAAMRTVNHPGNAVLAPLAARVRAALGLDPREPGVSRPLLDRVHAPRLAAVAEVFEPAARTTDAWRVDGTELAADLVHRTQLEWYAGRRELVTEALRRSVRTLAHLGLAVPG